MGKQPKTIKDKNLTKVEESKEITNDINEEVTENINEADEQIEDSDQVEELAEEIQEEVKNTEETESIAEDTLYSSANEPLVSESLVSETNTSEVSNIIFSDLNYKAKLDKLASINENYKLIIEVFNAYNEAYENIKQNNLSYASKDIKLTRNLYSSIRALLSVKDFYTFKDNLELLLMVVRENRLKSLNPLFYSSGLSNWNDEVSSTEFLSIMHTLNVIVIDGPKIALRTINFNKFAIGKEIEAYLHTL